MHQKVQSHTTAVPTQKTQYTTTAAAAQVYLHQRVKHTAVRQVVVSCEDIPVLQPQHNAVFRQCLTCRAKQVHWKPRKIQYLVVLERWSHCCMVNTDRPALVTTEATVIIRNTCCLHRTHNRAEVSEANHRWHRNSGNSKHTKDRRCSVRCNELSLQSDVAPTPRIRGHYILATRCVRYNAESLPSADVLTTARQGSAIQVQQFPAIALDLQHAEGEVEERGDRQGGNEQRVVAEAHS
jgi:hypothetical protein